MKLKDIINFTHESSAIVLASGLNDPSLVKSFIPTTSSIAVLKHIVKAVQPSANKEDRAINCYGIYGTGKSRLAVLIGQLLRDGINDDDLGGLLLRLEDANEPQLVQKLRATFLSHTDDDARPYLIVPIYANGDSAFSLQGTLLQALYNSVRLSGITEIDNILLPTEYDIAAKRLDEILISKPEYSNQFLPNIDNIGNQYLNLPQLRDGLVNHEPVALETFCTWHRHVTVGSEFDPVQYGASNFIDVYSHAAQALLEIRYKGIAIIWDEFGYALEDMLTNSKRAPVREIMDLQKFVETVCEPQAGQVLFIGLTHVSISEYGPSVNVPAALVNRLATIQGRFTPLRIELKAAESEGYHLIAAQIRTTPYGHDIKKGSPYALQIMNVCKNLSLFAHMEDELKYVIENCYPLHPIAAAALLALSARYAAATRTAFTFLKYLEDKEILEQTIDPNEIFSKELIRFPYLIDYYEERMTEESSNDIATFKRSCAQIDGNTADELDIYERRNVLSIIMLSNVLGMEFQPSQDFLAIALHDTEYISSEAEVLRKALAWLSTAGLIWKNETTGHWRTGGDGGTNLDELISNALEAVPQLSISKYSERYPELYFDLFPLIGIHLFDPSVKGIVRTYSISTIKDLTPASLRVSNGSNLVSRVYIVLSIGPEDALQIETEVKQLPVGPNFFWINYEDSTTLAQKIRRYLALTNLLEQSHSDAIATRLQANYDYDRNWIAEKLSFMFGREGLNRGVTKIIKQGEDVLSVSSWTDFRQFLENDIQKIYYSEISVRASQKKRNVLGDMSAAESAETIEIVNRIFEIENNREYKTDLLGYAENSAPGAVVDGILGANEFFTTRANGVGLKGLEELEGVYAEVINKIRSEVLRKRQTPYRLTELSKILAIAPYGIPSGAIPIIVAFALQSDVYKLTWVNGRTNVAENLCKGLLNQNIGVRVADFNQYHLNIAEVVYYAMREILGDQEPSMTDKQAMAKKSIEQLKNWLSEISPNIINSPKIDKRLHELNVSINLIGRTQHDLLDKIAELIDNEEALKGQAISYQIKDKARDTLSTILNSYLAVEDEIRHDAIDHVRSLFSDPEETDYFLNVRARFNDRGELGGRVINAIDSAGAVSSDKQFELVLNATLNQDLRTCTPIEIGIGIGQLKSILDEEKISRFQDIDLDSNKQALKLKLHDVIVGEADLYDITDDDLVIILTSLINDLKAEIVE